MIQHMSDLALSFLCVLRLQLLLLLIMETSLVTELTWELGSALLESVVDRCVGCVAGPWALGICVRTSLS